MSKHFSPLLHSNISLDTITGDSMMPIEPNDE